MRTYLFLKNVPARGSENQNGKEALFDEPLIDDPGLQTSFTFLYPSAEPTLPGLFRKNTGAAAPVVLK